MSIEAMQLALEALENLTDKAEWHDEAGYDAFQNGSKAITALRQAIAEAAKCGAIIEVFKTDWRLEYMSLPVGKHKLYTQQYLYAAPSQRKPLTNGEIYTAYITATNQTLRAQDEKLALSFARAIEAAHGIKE